MCVRDSISAPLRGWKCRALLIECRALLTEYRVILAEYRTEDALEPHCEPVGSPSTCTHKYMKSKVFRKIGFFLAECRASWVEFQAFLMECRAILMEYSVFKEDGRDFLMEYRAFMMDSGCLLMRYRKFDEIHKVLGT